ncbi:MAG TPA: hypothetical protein VLA00_12940 [Xanthobacteraceae bacterium]|nr:hypothetical protein [Xanthobacteraceae bacterium]
MPYREQARLARKQVEESKFRAGFLPRGHPYSKLPTWVPYWMAKLFMWILNEDYSSSAKGKKRGRRKS